MSRINKNLLLSLVLLFSSLNMQIVAQENNEESLTSSRGSWEVHAGIGMFLGVSGLPSQISNNLAMKEGFLQNVSNASGLPIGASLFTGFGYRFKDSPHSTGLELGVGFHQDGGRAQVTLGDNPENIPGYVFESLMGSIGYPEFAVPMFFTITQMYPGLTTTNTMKGYYLDPKIRVYHRYRKPNWNIQSGIGLGLIIPTNYFAYPSKIRGDFIFGEDDGNGIEASFDHGWKHWMGQGPITTTRIPFPLVMRDGTVMMRAVQPLADFNLRAGYRNYFLDVAYSTEFRHIHHVKIGLGIQFI